MLKNLSILTKHRMKPKRAIIQRQNLNSIDLINIFSIQKFQMPSTYFFKNKFSYSQSYLIREASKALLLGKTLEFEKKYKSALQQYNFAIEIQPNNYKAYMYRSILYIKISRFQEALKDIEFCIDNRYSLSQAYYSRGRVYRNIGKIAEAIEDFKKSQKYIRRENTMAIKQLGVTYLHYLKNYEKALEYFQIVRNNKFIGLEIEEFIAKCYLYMQKYQQAITIYKKLLNSTHDEYKIYTCLGMAYKKLGKFSQSNECLLKCISLKPSFAQPYNQRANLLFQNGNYLQALIEYVNATTLLHNTENINGIINCYNKMSAQQKQQVYRRYGELLLRFNE